MHFYNNNRLKGDDSARKYIYVPLISYVGAVFIYSSSPFLSRSLCPNISRSLSLPVSFSLYEIVQIFVVIVDLGFRSFNKKMLDHACTEALRCVLGT